MKSIERFGVSTFGDRRLYLLEADHIESIPRSFQLESRFFVCVLAVDGEDLPDDRIWNLARGLVGSGCAYLCVWGPGCERVHDQFDLELVAMEAETPSATDVMTTWHDKEPLPEALWYALNVAWPAAEFEDQCASTLVVSVGRPDWAEICREALRDPDAFNRRVLAEEADEGTAQQGRQGGRG